MTTPTATTPDTALAVIERHLSEWRQYRRAKEIDGDEEGVVYGGGGVRAMQELRDELRAAPPPDTWNADREPFDPVRAGMQPDIRYGGCHVGDADWGEDAKGLVFIARDGDRWIVELEDGYDFRFYLPATLPHNTVISILRANGWEGGDDESV